MEKAQAPTTQYRLETDPAMTSRQRGGVVTRTIGVIAAELEEALRASGRIRVLREELDAAMGKIKRPRVAKGTP
jgi:hypothetical protein